MPGGTELIIIAIVIIVLFGAKKLPGLGRGLGQSIKNFKDAKGNEEQDDKKDDMKKDA